MNEESVEQTPWAENDELFIQELKTGHDWQSWPALFFKLHGLVVEMPKLTIRKNISEANKWKDSFDLIVEGLPFENKSRDESFTYNGDFPYPTIIVDTVKGYDAKEIKPHAYLHVSRPEGTMLWLPSLSNEKWSIESIFDNTRNITDKFYMCETKHLRPISTLVKFLKNKRLGK